MHKDDPPVIVEATFNAGVDRVWSAITDIGQMPRWFFETIPAVRPETGFQVQFDVQSGDRNFRHLWTVIDVLPRKMIAYNWKYQEYAGDSVVMFELFPQDDSTTLRLTHTVHVSFPEDIPEFTRESCIGGWTFFIGKRLKEHLEKNA